jgi:type II restriction enzyme
MSKIEEAQDILKALGLPKEQQNKRSALVFLALANIKEDDAWSAASSKRLGVSLGIMKFIEEAYDTHYKPNSRETLRRHSLHQFVNYGIAIENPDNRFRPPNSPDFNYVLADDIVLLIQKYGTQEWDPELNNYRKKHQIPVPKAKDSSRYEIDVMLSDGTILKLPKDEHNELQKAVVDEFIPRFAPNSEVIHLGTTKKKDLYQNKELLSSLNIDATIHGKLPDIMIYDGKRDRIFLIESVAHHGPVSATRRTHLGKLLSNCSATRIYVTVFKGRDNFKTHLKEIAWETEVWLSEDPHHLIHFNGDCFLFKPT